MLNVGINTQKAIEELNLLMLTPQKRRRIMRGAGRKVRRDTRARLKGQSDLSGKAWKKRSNGRKNRMLKKIGRKLIVKTTENNAVVTFGDTRTAQIARAHQDGDSYEGNLKSLDKKYGKLNGERPATRRQAKALLKEEYRVRKSRGQGLKKPSIKWIVGNLSIKRAGAVLRAISPVYQQSRRRWDHRIRERSFLGQELEEYKQLKNYMLDEAMRLG